MSNDTTTEARTWLLTEAEWDATLRKIDKINRRAERRGFTGRFQATAERVERERQTAIHGLTVTEVWMQVTLSGEAPCYGGCRFLARLDWDQHAGLIVSTAPGVEHVDRDGLREGWCDHCRTKRHRTCTYLVANEAGERRQVGSTCIKDFTGWGGAIAFLSAGQVEEEIDELGVGCGTGSDAWATETVLAVAWASIKARGFHSSRGFERSTKDHVWAFLRPHSAAAAEEAAEMQPYVADSYAQARIIRRWILEELDGDSNYAINLRAVAEADHCSVRNLGLLVSAPQVWARAQERDLVRRREQEEVVNEWVGQVKDKLELEATIKSIRPIDSHWGTTFLYTLLADTGHVYKWFSSRAALGDTADGTVIRLRGTVKAHEEYRGAKSTVLTRCKVLESREPAEPATVAG